jgi:hypothetical protein
LSDLNLFLKFAERSRVGALVLFKELKNLLDAFGVELEADAVEVLRLVLPEVKFSHGLGVFAVLQGVFWVLFEDVLDLFLPVNNGGYIQIKTT